MDLTHTSESNVDKAFPVIEDSPLPKLPEGVRSYLTKFLRKEQFESLMAEGRG